MRGAAPWLCLGAAIVIALIIPDWQGGSTPKPFWMLLLPAVCGVVGGILAARDGRTGLAVGASVIGVLAVPVLLAVVTLIYGP